MTTPINKKQAITRGFFNKCPKCGVGKILHGYITPYKECSNCGQDFTALNSDDGPAWATILISGHLTMPIIFLMLDMGLDNMWIEISIPITFIIGLSALILPRAKGVFMAIMWIMRVNKPT